ncbi:hypothetical protein VKT23_011554 [Stygiomarasmius scandens]|uniref:F-box domain-containing protein n=1 Tax=Marasmiellus scandens TaxID=2682957 RepID=A0ABR1J9G7_9AGAR
MSTVSLFSTFPEELVDRILQLAVSRPAVPVQRPTWHVSSPTATTTTPTTTTTRTRLSTLLVSKSFHRIVLPHFYNDIHISSTGQAQALLHVLHENPAYIQWISRIHLAGIFDGVPQLVTLCTQVRVLDLTLDAGSAPTPAPAAAAGTAPLTLQTALPATDPIAQAFCTALSSLNRITHLVIRKGPTTYLTQPRVRYVLTALAESVSRWEELEDVDMPFKVSSDDSTSATSPISAVLGGMLFPALNQNQNQNQGAVLPQAQTPTPATPTTPGSPKPQGPVTLLAHALSSSPRLRSFSTHIPTVWNEVLLVVSKNPSLEKIVLGEGSSGPGLRLGGGRASISAGSGISTSPSAGGVVFTGLYMSEAKKHPKLVELIKAGTPILRNRSQTVASRGALVSSASMSSIPTLASTSATSSSAAASSSACAATEKRSLPVTPEDSPCQFHAGSSSAAPSSPSTSTRSFRRRSLAV